MNNNKPASLLRRWKFGLGTASLLAAGGIVGFLGSHLQGYVAIENDAPPAAVGAANDLSAAFRYASGKVMPAVVMIRSQPGDTQKITDESNQGMPEDLPPQLRKFFGENMPHSPRQQPAPRGEGMGSGVIIDASGVILTNNHVVQGGKITVRLQDGREFKAIDVKTDPKTDLAVVRIDGAGKLPVATLANSDAVQIGDWVLAVGAPFGLKETVTAGIISAKSRGIGINEREDFLQTDAAINPGNSGGPLVNIRGEIIGINTAISSRSGGNEGIGFSVPSNVAKWVSTQLMKDGTVHRAFLGVGIQPVTSELSKQLGLSMVRGALITEVRPNSAAATAGLETGDVILEFAKQPVNGPRELQNVVERAALDQQHELVVYRQGERKVLMVSLQTAFDTKANSPKGQGSKQPASMNCFGMELNTLTDEVSAQLGLEGKHGVVITAIKPGSMAEQAGLREGMVISRVGKAEIKSLSDFQNAMKNAKTQDGVLLLVHTQQGSQFLVLKSN